VARQKLIIYGNGHMARTFYHFARLEYEVTAFTVDRSVLNTVDIEGIPVIPFDSIERHMPPADHRMITAVGFIEMNRLRERKYREAKQKGYGFVNYIHPSVVRHSNFELGENNIVLEHASIHPYTRFGHSNFLCSNISIGHGCRINDNCWINSGVSIGGGTTIESGCVLGINASIEANLVIAEGCYVGANTLIAKSTSANSTYVSASGERFPLTSVEFLSFLARKPG
jgi:sugar O-acyltransferase (sialic acid O-acetyltransferase NeuD family)